LVCIWLDEIDHRTELAAKVIEDITSKVEKSSNMASDEFMTSNARFQSPGLIGLIFQQASSQVRECRMEGYNGPIAEALPITKHRGPRSELNTAEIRQQVQAVISIFRGRSLSGFRSSKRCTMHQRCCHIVDILCVIGTPSSWRLGG